MIDLGVIAKLPERNKKIGEKVLVLTNSGIKEAGILRKIEDLLISNNIEYEVFPDVKSEPPVNSLETCARILNKKIILQ